MEKRVLGFDFEEVKEIRKALALSLEKMRDNDEIEDNEDRFQMISELYDFFYSKEDELEEEIDFLFN